MHFEKTIANYEKVLLKKVMDKISSYQISENDEAKQLMFSKIQGIKEKYEKLKDVEKILQNQISQEKWNERFLDSEEWASVKEDVKNLLIASNFKDSDIVFEDTEQRIIIADTFSLVPCSYLDIKDSLMKEELSLQEKQGWFVDAAVVLHNYPSEPDFPDNVPVDFAQDHLSAAEIVIENFYRQIAENITMIISENKIFGEPDDLSPGM